jgi:hypothetical protein
MNSVPDPGLFYAPIGVGMEFGPFVLGDDYTVPGAYVEVYRCDVFLTVFST